MSNNQDVIIENVIRDTYMVFKLNPFENKTVIDSILKENKEKLGQKSGKDNLQKGVELT